jgi:histidinol-phosphatase
MPFEAELAAALRWLDATDPIALSSFGGAVATETKPDGTPVTVADRAVEEALREAVARDFPGDGVLGEEGGAAAGSGGRRWIVDPIDGTKNYARGIPVFATLIALEDSGGLAVGLVSAPALRTRWWAVRGGGAFRDGAPIMVSGVADLAQADVCSGGLDWARSTGHAERLWSLLGRTRRHRGFGDFWGYMLVAQGSLEVMVEFAPLALWDIAAPRIIVEEAGGRWTGPAGEAAPAAGAALATNGVLHDEVLAVLGGA